MQEINADTEKRIETGHLRINDDWCGVFIRGDNAKILGFELERLLSDKHLIHFSMTQSILEIIQKLPK